MVSETGIAQVWTLRAGALLLGLSTSSAGSRFGRRVDGGIGGLGTSCACPAGWVDEARLVAAAEAESGSWLAHGQTYDELRFSTLTQINRDTVGELGLAWVKNLNIPYRLQATPLVIDGVMYFTDSWSVAYAVDARNGEEIWRFDPETDRRFMRYSCCGGPSNRGVAAYKGRITSRLSTRVSWPSTRRPARRSGTWTRRTTRRTRRTPSPERPGPCTARSSSARAARSSVCGGTCPPTMPTPASSPGGSSRYPVIPPSPSSIPNSRKPPRPGRASGGNWVAAARRGTPSSTTPSSTSSSSARATARRGRARSGLRGAETTCSSAASCR